VVLVAGGGPLDRDVTFLGHKLFRRMAHQLAKAGIASLRFDKRGVGESQGDFGSAGPDEFVADVMGAAEYLIDGEGFARERTGLVGHSEGGTVALTAAPQIEGAAFCVLLASPLLSGVDNFARSMALLARGNLHRDADYDGCVSDLLKLLEIVRSDEAPERDPRALEMAAKLAPRACLETSS
jgi:alpha/beta superfamily hydrolase